MSDLISDEDVFDDLPGRDGNGVDVLAPAGPATTVRARDPRQRLRSSRFGTLIVLLVTTAVVVAGAWLVQRQQQQDAAAQTGGATVVKLPGNSRVPPPEVGKPAQDFSLTTHDGRTLSLSQLRGRTVWVTFGASWCAACQAEVPDIQAAHESYADRGVVVLGVNITEDNAAVRAYAERVGLTYPIGADPNSLVADDYAVSAIPAHYFIDRDGVVRDIRQGSLAPAVMEGILDKLVTP